MENLNSSWLSSNFQEEKELSRAKVFNLHVILCPTSHYTAEAGNLKKPDSLTVPGSLAGRVLNSVFASDIYSHRIWMLEGKWRPLFCRDDGWWVPVTSIFAVMCCGGMVLVALVRARAIIVS